MTIIRDDTIPEKFCREEVEQWESEMGRKVEKAEFRDNKDGTCTEKIWPTTVKFNRIRRITGYLVGDLNRFNDAKLSEVKDRVSHTTEG